MLKKLFTVAPTDTTEEIAAFADDFVRIRKSNREKSRKMNVQIHQCILTILANVDESEQQLACIPIKHRASS